MEGRLPRGFPPMTDLTITKDEAQLLRRLIEAKMDAVLDAAAKRLEKYGFGETKASTANKLISVSSFFDGLSRTPFDGLFVG